MIILKIILGAIIIFVAGPAIYKSTNSDGKNEGLAIFLTVVIVIVLLRVMLSVFSDELPAPEIDWRTELFIK